MWTLYQHIWNLDKTDDYWINYMSQNLLIFWVENINNLKKLENITNDQYLGKTSVAFQFIKNARRAFIKNHIWKSISKKQLKAHFF